MIEPVRHGEALLTEIHGTHPAPAPIAVWWLGQSGYLIKSRFGTLIIDPYLSEHLTRKHEATAKLHVRMTRAPLRGSDLGGVDLVLSSHQHSDHLDPKTMPDLPAASPGAPLGPRGAPRPRRGARAAARADDRARLGQGIRLEGALGPRGPLGARGARRRRARASSLSGVRRRGGRAAAVS